MMAATQTVFSFLNTPVNSTTSGMGMGMANDTLPLALPMMLQPVLAFIPSALLPFVHAVLRSPAALDWIKIFVLGGMLETVRRILGQAWSFDSLLSGLYLHVRIDKEDEAYEWLLAYFMRLPAFNRTRNVCVSTRIRGKGNASSYIEGCHCSECSRKRPKAGDLSQRLHYLPAYECDYSFFFGGTYVTVMRTRQSGPANNTGAFGIPLASIDSLDLRILSIVPSRGRAVLERLLTIAKTAFDKDEEERISIWVGDSYGSWNRAASKLRRPWSSIVLEPGMKETLLADAKDFLSSQAWYVQRGIPYRRGYLLHGVPGSGKTSLIHALAGELKLDIYVIPLSKKTMDDSALNEIVAALPPQCIALMEDIDCAFTKGIGMRAGAGANSGSQEEEVAKDENAPTGLTAAAPTPDAAGISAGNITLSGLLNAIDGVAAHEGRLLFATTNVREALDPALIRPGRMDVVLEFKNASQAQAEELFKCFYPVEDADAPGDECTSEEKKRAAAGRSKHFAAPTAVAAAALPPTPPRTPSPEGTPLITIEPLPSAGPPSTLTREARDLLAARFAALVTNREFSMAALQGYLMLHKVDPVRCVDELETWIGREREDKLKRKAREEREEEERRRREDVKREAEARVA